MKKRLLLSVFSLSALFGTIHAQSARTESLADLSVDGSEQSLRFTVQDVSWTHAQMKNNISALQQVPGVTYYNPVVKEGETSGHFDLRFKVASKAALQQLLREVFCTLNIGHVELGQATFNDCRLIVVP